MNSTLIWIVFLGFYAYSSIAFQVIADKTNTPDGWWAWVPILSLFLMLAIAKRPGWWPDTVRGINPCNYPYHGCGSGCWQAA